MHASKVCLHLEVYSDIGLGENNINNLLSINLNEVGWNKTNFECLVLRNDYGTRKLWRCSDVE
jgi:hypothetical protein